MNPLFIVGGLVAIVLLLEYQQASIAAEIKKVTTPANTGVVVGAQPSNLGSSTDNTDAEVTSGLSTANSLDPDPTGISQGVLKEAAAIASIFTRNHAAAVAKEASTLNSVVPTWKSSVSQTMAALNEGAITPAQAISYINQAQANYYTTVAGIIKKGGPCSTQCTVGALSNTGKPQGWVSTQPTCCNTSSTCNASCCIGCYMVEPTTRALTQIIQQGGGSFTIPSAQANGAIQGSPAVTITYTPTSTQAAPSLSSAIGSLF
jgi:hypothetical protein